MMKYTCSQEMKICFIYELLYSIRGDFSRNSALRERKNLAVKLTKLAIQEYKGRVSSMLRNGVSDSFGWGNIEDIKDHIRNLEILLKTIEHFKPFKQDGRYFREEFPFGYIGMLEHFGIEKENYD